MVAPGTTLAGLCASRQSLRCPAVVIMRVGQEGGGEEALMGDSLRVGCQWIKLHPHKTNLSTTTVLSTRDSSHTLQLQMDLSIWQQPAKPAHAPLRAGSPVQWVSLPEMLAQAPRGLTVGVQLSAKLQASEERVPMGREGYGEMWGPKTGQL